MAIIRREMGPTSVMERASIDEAYLDVTSTVDALLSALAAPQPPEPAICRASGEWAGRRPSAAQAWAVAFWQRGGTLAEAMAGGGGAAVGSDTVVVGGPLQDGLESDQRLRLGALLAARIRERVLAELTFTCSAGVAPNKLLAKIGSAMHKPSQQTVILPRGVGSLMGPMPLRKIGGFGGKLGDALARLGCVTAGDVCGLPPGTLDRIFEPQVRREGMGWHETGCKH